MNDSDSKFAAGSWEKDLLDALRGKSTYKDLLASAEKSSRVISAKCFAGLCLLPSKQSEQGKEFLRSVVESGERHLDEYSLAYSALHPPHPVKTTVAK